MNKTTPLYTASEVEERTGIAANTLRQWERRYGIPNPSRAANGYRLYSQNDLECIQFIQAHIENGVTVSRAVELLKQKQDPGTPQSPDNEHTKVVQDLVEACLKSDQNRASQLINYASISFTVEEVLLKVIEPTLTYMGEMWAQGHITVAEEHQATAFLRGRIQILLDLLGQPLEGPKVMVACAPGEYHEIGPLMISVLLRKRGVQVHYIGANTPLDDLIRYTHAHSGHAILLSLGLAADTQLLRRHAEELKQLDIPVIMGGALLNAEPALAEEFGGTYLGADTLQAVEQMVQILEGGV
ncbi:MerR family transcriptional regulator [Deinococcus cellulosilyticus]|uniref:MerR family transcriptional regulator n=1 Tax=Deinococcus cellulosilyticus (strain DSM 18568 / NBRC 106333 / KACC 11606 / 5516J-15) TaxID=1223518 RepID=A0A511N8E8_DEIC1|nr:MerR family transcriptional regulator [Deinococcus cellulosilyticus]GEM48797.1 MerR family transcriptional regulator [Deinococcus cellulosilyticus NBRC 106333 = KACC 11606]